MHLALIRRDLVWLDFSGQVLLVLDSGQRVLASGGRLRTDDLFGSRLATVDGGGAARNGTVDLGWRVQSLRGLGRRRWNVVAKLLGIAPLAQLLNMRTQIICTSLIIANHPILVVEVAGL